MVLFVGFLFIFEKMIDFIRLKNWIFLKYNIFFSLVIEFEEKKEVDNEILKKMEWIFWRNYIKDEKSELELSCYFSDG